MELLLKELSLTPSVGLKTLIAPVHLPIIKPPQYNEIYLAISVSPSAGKPSPFRLFTLSVTNFKTSP
jgi:hypothetical protein